MTRTQCDAAASAPARPSSGDGDTTDSVKDARTQQLARQFTLLDAAFGFLSKHRVVMSLRNVVNMANSLGGVSATAPGALTVDDVRAMVRIAPALLAIHVMPTHETQHTDDIYRPSELAPLDREILTFIVAPQSSKRASTKRKQLFEAALAHASIEQLALSATAATTTSEFTQLAAQQDTHSNTATGAASPFASITSGNDAIAHWVQALTSLPFYDQQLVHVERRAARAPQFAALETLQLPPRVVAALAARGITQLYSHQFEAIAALQAGENVVLSTATASGKSLAYNVPMLTTLLNDERVPDATFLYLFPTKALAQDQLKALRSFLVAAGLPPHVGNTFDGDTPMTSRSMLLRDTQVFLTNPDMLHLSILPRHTQWKRVLARLQLIVVDEAHMYRGVFGSHVACVFRRLFRLCALYGANPQVVCCSATIRNPREHFELLLPPLPRKRQAVVLEEEEEEESSSSSSSSPAHLDFFHARPLRVITVDGAPTGEKVFCLWNPTTSNSVHRSSVPPAIVGAKRKRIDRNTASLPTTAMPAPTLLDTQPTDNDADDDAEEAIVSASPIFQSAHIFARFINRSVHTLLFCRGRKLAEHVLMSVHSVLRTTTNGRALLRRVSTYRGGYTLADRRSIEQRLFTGDLLGVIATNALELGIDVGDLDCTMHLGLPSSVASLWQQAGRAGRQATQQSIAVIVCFDAPIDQHFARHARELFALPPEAVALNPHNPHVLAQHLLCAARESPLYAPRSGTSYIDASLFGALSPSSTAPSSSTTALGVIVASLVADHKLQQCRPGDGGGFRVHATMPKQFRTVNLRSIDDVIYQVVTDDLDQTLLDEIPGDVAFKQVYPTAVYLHQATEYIITRVDNASKRAFAQRCVKPLDYFTTSKHVTTVDVVHVHSTRLIRVNGDTIEEDAAAIASNTVETNAHELRVCVGVVSVLTRITGATALAKRSMRKLYATEFTLPPIEAIGHALWLEVPTALTTIVETAGANWHGALHGASHVCVAVVALFVLCDNADVNTEHSNPLERRVGSNRLTIFERREGGSGIIGEVHRTLPQIVAKAQTIVRECRCDAGCPACIHSSECSAFNKLLDKRGALLVLDFVHAALDRDDSQERLVASSAHEHK